MLSKEYLGLYFSEVAIAGAYGEKNRNGTAVIKDIFNCTLPAGIIINGHIVMPKELREIVKTVVHKQKLTGKKTTLAISTNNIVNRLVNMPQLTEEELNEAVFWEIKPFLTLGIDSMYFDHSVLQKLNQVGQVSQVYIAALPKQLLNSYLQFIKDVDLIPYRIETSWIVLFRLWQLIKMLPEFKSQINDSWCLFLERDGRGILVANDLRQGYTIRQIVSSSSSETLAEELSHISLYLQEKYQRKFYRVFTIGEYHELYDQAFCNQGIEIIKLEMSNLIRNVSLTLETGLENFTECSANNFIYAYALYLGEILYGSN